MGSKRMPFLSESQEFYLMDKVIPAPQSIDERFWYDYTHTLGGSMVAIGKVF